MASAKTCARADLGEDVLAVRLGRVDQREARHDVQAVAPVRPVERLRDPPRVALGLLQADDVRPRRADRLDDLGEVDVVAAEPDVERHDPHVDRGRRGERDGRGLRPGGRNDRERGEGERRREDGRAAPDPARDRHGRHG